jgi:hypothetical protein
MVFPLPVCIHIYSYENQVWEGTPAILALRRSRQKDCEIKVSLGYIMRAHFSYEDRSSIGLGPF